MTVDFSKKHCPISEIRRGECFKVNNYTVFLMTDTQADSTLTGKKAVNLLTGGLTEFSDDYIVERVHCEVVVG